jgi:hypothetical protein
MIIRKIVILFLLLVGFTQHSVSQLRPKPHDSVQSYQDMFTSEITSAELARQPFEITSMAELSNSQEQTLLWHQSLYTDTPDTANLKPLWKPGDVGTIVKQLGTGSFYAVSAGAVGFLVGLAVSPKGMGSIATTLVGGAIGFETGLVIGVYNAGRSERGNGTLVGTLLGVPAGAGAGILFLLLPKRSSNYGPDQNSFSTSQYLMVAILAIAGPIVGYHLSATTVYERNNSGSGAGVTLTPIFDRSQRGIQVAFTF